MAARGLALLYLALATLSFSLAIAVSPAHGIAHSEVTADGDHVSEPIGAISARNDDMDDEDDDNDDEYFYGTANSVDLNVRRTLLELVDICDGLINLPKEDKFIAEICYFLDKQNAKGGEVSDWEQPIRNKRSPVRGRTPSRSSTSRTGRRRVVHTGTGSSRNSFSNSGSRRRGHTVGINRSGSRSRTRSRSNSRGRVGHGGLPRSQLAHGGVRPGHRAIGSSSTHIGSSSTLGRRPGQSLTNRRGGLGHGGLPRSQNAARGIRPGQSALGTGSEHATWTLFHRGSDRAVPFRNSVSRHGVPTTEYTRQGSYQDALRDFNSFNPTNVRSWTNPNNGYSGQTGRVNQQTITVRDNSDTHGGANLDIYSNPINGAETLHKIRYTGTG